MNYQLENLGADRFQQFCQSLLVQEFPKLQCFPVGQPDGGRDALSYLANRASDEFIVFQVKFVKKPFTVPDPHKWLIDILKQEVPKVTKQIPKGAKEYYLLTNVPGTAHSQTGSIDLVQEILDKHLGIPAFCWWRDDLNSRLDNSWNLKWVYPELMTGIDMLRHIVQSQLSERAETRISAIKTFVRDQYEEDKEVRFKQIELQNQLLDLFIDIPMIITSRYNEGKQPRKYLQILQQVMIDTPTVSENMREKNLSRYRRFLHEDSGEGIGSATVLLHPLVQKEIPQLVIEGAPGQGKSTIAQYVCQVHRMKILGEEKALMQLPEQHRATAARIPFKVDLRDLATWLNEEDPFLPLDSVMSSGGKRPPRGWHRSLESFLSAQVRFHAGGLDFVVEDLHAIVKLSAIVLMFDGLDEVADISARLNVVQEVMAGVRRLRESTNDIQVIVTSRPAAFANSPGFPEDQYPHFELGSITRNLIDGYADRWLDARKLRSTERKEVKRILKDKLDEPHLRELARNPMQLAILLSLIHTRGSSLPDKRTALYDSYVELFFNREAEKSNIVREHRDLLVDIHQFLAWYLHSESEQGNRRGNISSDKLQNLLAAYLETEQRDSKIADLLFTGMVERVVALVSRVEGTYEFEVQPLREYFAARYLYETAPYSPPGKETRGTKPDRFDAIARNFYWLNVTRFYAGCYSKGELPSLISCLHELVQEDGYRYTNHPRILAMILLSDWVFAQHQQSMKEAVSLVIDGLGLRYALNGNRVYRGYDAPWILPKDSGKDELIQRCFDLLQEFPGRDFAREITHLLKANSDREELLNKWREFALRLEGENRTRWMDFGLMLGLLPLLTIDEIEYLMSDNQDRDNRYRLLFYTRKRDFFKQEDYRLEQIVDLILDGTISSYPDRQGSDILEQLVHTMNPIRYAIAFQSKHPTPLSEYLEMHFLFHGQRTFDPFQPDADRGVGNDDLHPLLKKCLEVIEEARVLSQRSGKEWATSLDPWDSLVEKSRSIFGERWTHFHLANIASGIKSRDETYSSYSDLFDRKLSLCRRTRYARLRAGNPKWWEEQASVIRSDLDQMHFLLILLTWGSKNTLLTLMDHITLLLDQLSQSHWQRLIRSLQETIGLAKTDNGITIDANDLPTILTHRTATTIALRVRDKHVPNMYRKYLSNYDGNDSAILSLCQRASMQLLRQKDDNWMQHLEVVKRSYAQGIVVDDYDYISFVRGFENDPLPQEVAERIAQEPQNYPHFLASLAEARWRKIVSDEIKPVGKIAKEQGWFSELKISSGR